MVEITVRITERQLADMDRLLRNEGIQGNQWLKDAVAIYKSILTSRKARYALKPQRRPRSLTGARRVACAG